MNRILKFLRTTLVGGLLFLVPIVVLLGVLGKALAVAHRLVEPLAARVPVESVIGLRTAALLAIGILVSFCFLAGLLARTALAQRVVRKLEAAVLSNLPGYEFFKGMGESLLGVEKEGAYPVVLVRFDDNWQIGFRVDQLEKGLVAVFVPGAPNPRSGSVHFMTPDRVTLADSSPAAALKCLQRLGANSAALLRGKLGGPCPGGSSTPGDPKPTR